MNTGVMCWQESEEEEEEGGELALWSSEVDVLELHKEAGEGLGFSILDYQVPGPPQRGPTWLGAASPPSLHICSSLSVGTAPPPNSSCGSRHEGPFAYSSVDMRILDNRADRRKQLRGGVSSRWQAQGHTQPGTSPDGVYALRRQ